MTAKKQTTISAKEVTIVQKKEMSLNEALFAFQSENLSIPKKGIGEIRGRKYNYATLDDLVNTIRPVLNKYNLMFTQVMDGMDFITKLVNIKTNEELVGKLPLGNPSSSQDLGSRITYLRRYALISMLGLVTEEDVDGIQATPASTKPVMENPPKGSGSSDTTIKKEEDNIQSSGSPAFMKATQAVESCMSVDALDLVAGQIEKSTKLTSEEKTSLDIVIINKKSDLTNA